MLLGTFSSIFAQDDSGQVLIFRNTGEINLLFASEIDSIVCSSVKTENSNDEVVPSQLFYTKDTTLVVPVSEIDSVAFGSRNAIEPKANVRMMASEDSLWITGYDGDYVYYKGNTPDNILPKVDEKLFYGQCDDLFPVGLVAKVLDVQKNGDSYSVKVENVELDQLFNRLFFSGAINDDAPITRSANTEDAYQKRILHINSNIGVTGGQIEGEREETIYKLNSVSETISEMAESYKQVAATTIETDEELEEDSKKAFKEELTNNIEDFTDNLLYEDFVYSDEEILDSIYDILEEKEEITKEELIKILENNNNYIIGLDKKEEKYEEIQKDLEQIVKAINHTYRINKLNLIWKQKEANNKRTLANQLRWSI